MLWATLVFCRFTKPKTLWRSPHLLQLSLCLKSMSEDTGRYLSHRTTGEYRRAEDDQVPFSLSCGQRGHSFRGLVKIPWSVFVY